MASDREKLVEQARTEAAWDGYQCELLGKCADRIEADAAALAERDKQIAVLREALEKIAAKCVIPLGTDKQMYARWRKLAATRVDIARAALETRSAGGGDE